MRVSILETRRELEEIREYLLSSKMPGRITFVEKGNWKKKDRKFCLDEEKRLCKEIRKGGVCIGFARVFSEEDRDEKLAAINRFHFENGHPRRDKMVCGLLSSIYDVSLGDSIAVISLCPNCRGERLYRTQQPLWPILALRARERYITDFMMSVPMKGRSGDETEAALREGFLRHGAPAILHTDNGEEFRDGKVHEMCRSFQTRMVNGRSRHPKARARSNGRTRP
ncbi:MAG: uncharacterized protein A8A55_2132 [Amphiamblys sp. WSBS2006]|nr:MAG: uncharacterized protein A8A55_2132 [Amphiamblys sp. WSBS2006]